MSQLYNLSDGGNYHGEKNTSGEENRNWWEGVAFLEGWSVKILLRS